MDFAARTQHEQDLQAAVAAVFALFRDRLAGGGTISLLEFRQALTAAIETELSATFLAAAQQLAEGRGIGFDDAETAAGTWSRAQANALAGDLASSVQDQLAEGLVDGESPEAFADRILSDSRAESIGITETTRAVTQGMDLAAAAIVGGSLGVAAVVGTALLMNRTWHTFEDNNVCDVCEPYNGKDQRTWGLAFPNGPPAHPRCRCRLEYGELPS